MPGSLQQDSAGWGWRPVGDAAWALEVGGDLDLAVNARMRLTADAVVREAIPGVRDVVPAVASVTVHVDPLRFRQADAHRFPPLAAGAAGPAGRLHEVPVRYDGADLASAAAATGLPVNEVLRRHAAPEYTVLMLGFAPGVPYMAPLDARLTLGRRPTPRARVPRGSVAAAAGMTCIYPGGTAGGWQILGRTNFSLFQPDAMPPARLAPGDRVRFVPVDDLGADEGLPVPGPAPGASKGGLRVLRAGTETTVQDLGRWGFQALGVPVSGACESLAFRLANRAVGNPDGAAGLEVASVGPDLRAEEDVVVAYAGAPMDAQLDGRPMLQGVPVLARAGAVIRCGEIHGGLRAYLAVAGGLDVPVVLGSRSTCLPGGFGGFAGRALAAGDTVGIANAAAGGLVPPSRPQPPSPGREPGQPVRLRVLPGPQFDAVGGSDVAYLLSGTFRVTRELNRVACRLRGEPARVPAAGRERLPAGTVPGAIQLTPSGELLLLLADRQTTGGYPQVLSVITADLGAAGQLCPGDSVRYELCSSGEAAAALAGAETALPHHG